MNNQQKWTTENIPDQSGKIVLVTGANSGLGYQTARALALKRATVIMACRNLEKAESAAAQMRREKPQGKLILKQLDLADLSSVKSFAQAFLTEFNRLDVLINNAGVMIIPYHKTKDGFEMQFGTNHLGHFALTGRLINLLESTPQARVVTVSSFAHMIGTIHFEDLNSEKEYQKWAAYAQSKLANILFAYELQRRCAKNGGNPISVTVHPGYVTTNSDNTSWFFRQMSRLMAQSPEMGMLPTLYAATSPEIQGGEYIGPDGFFGQRGSPHRVQSSTRSYNQETAQRLWAVSEKMTGVQFNS